MCSVALIGGSVALIGGSVALIGGSVALIGGTTTKERACRASSLMYMVLLYNFIWRCEVLYTVCKLSDL